MHFYLDLLYCQAKAPKKATMHEVPQHLTRPNTWLSAAPDPSAALP